MELNLENVLKLEPDFQMIIDFVEGQNQNNPNEEYFRIWEAVKKINKENRLMGFDAKHSALMTPKAYEWMGNFVEKLSKHK